MYRDLQLPYWTAIDKDTQWFGSIQAYSVFYVIVGNLIQKFNFIQIVFDALQPDGPMA